MILADHLRDLVRRSALPPALKTELLKLDDPVRFLAECMDLSLGPTPVPASSARHETAEASRWGLPLLGAAAAFATLFGGIAWNLLNRLAGWQYFMGSADGGMAALPALAWGAITMAPIAAPFILLCEHGARRRAAAAAAAFTAVGAACAVLFHAGGIRAAVEATGAAYAVREAVIVVLFGVVTTVLPQAAAVATLRRHTRLRRAAALCLVPSPAALLAFLVTLLVDRPEPEVIQLRGLAVGAALRLSLFIVLAASFLAHFAPIRRPP
jgi:rhodanese-related sulfurtransferase